MAECLHPEDAVHPDPGRAALQRQIDGGPGLKHLLQRACTIGRRRADLKTSTLKAYEADLEQRLDRIMALDPARAAGFKRRRMIRKA